MSKRNLHKKAKKMYPNQGKGNNYPEWAIQNERYMLPYMKTYQNRNYTSSFKDSIFVCEELGLSETKYLSKDKEDKAKEVLDWEEVDGQLVFNLLPSQVATKREHNRSVQCCVFNGTDSYLRGTQGFGLAPSDKEWYTNLDCVASSGLQQEMTLDVVQELISPYNMGIKEVFIQIGNMPTMAFKRWMVALGTNPVAMEDFSTTDEEYYNSFDDTSKPFILPLLKDFRFHFVRTLPFGQYMQFSQTGITSFASGGGHCSHRAPRDTNSNWYMCITLDKIENCVYHTELPHLHDPMKVNERPVLDLDKCLDNNGSTLDSYVFSYQTIGYNKEQRAKPLEVTGEMDLSDNVKSFLNLLEFPTTVWTEKERKFTNGNSEKINQLVDRVSRGSAKSVEKLMSTEFTLCDFYLSWLLSSTKSTLIKVLKEEVFVEFDETSYTAKVEDFESEIAELTENVTNRFENITSSMKATWDSSKVDRAYNACIDVLEKKPYAHIKIGPILKDLNLIEASTLFEDIEQEVGSEKAVFIFTEYLKWVPKTRNFISS